MTHDNNPVDHPSDPEKHEKRPQQEDVVQSIKGNAEKQDAKDGEDTANSHQKPFFAVRFIHFLWRRRIYVNGDVKGLLDLNTGKVEMELTGPFFGAKLPTHTVYFNPSWGPFPGDPGFIYTWDNNHTQLRGPGGDPTEPCGGFPL
jgi:hypothetical protein